MQKSTVVLAGGFSRRFGNDKGLVLLWDKPLVRHVIGKVVPAVDELIVVLAPKNKRKTLNRLWGKK